MGSLVIHMVCLNRVYGAGRIVHCVQSLYDKQNPFTYTWDFEWFSGCGTLDEVWCINLVLHLCLGLCEWTCTCACICDQETAIFVSSQIVRKVIGFAGAAVFLIILRVRLQVQYVCH